MGFERIATLTWKHPRKVLLALGLFMLTAGALGGKVEEHLQAAGFSDPDSESEIAVEVLRSELGYDATPGIAVLVSEPGSERIAIASKPLRAEVARVAGRLGEAEFVTEVVNPLARLDRALERRERAEAKRERAVAKIKREVRAGVAAAGEQAAQAAAAGLEPPPAPDVQALIRREIRKLPKPPKAGEIVREFRQESPLIADDKSSIVITGHLSSDDPENDGGVAAADAKELLSSETLELGLSGFAISFDEVENQTRKDLTRAELIAFPVLALLLLLVFRGVVAAAIPLLVGVASILGTFLALRIMSELTPTSLFALNITTALSLGLAVDYALLMISRYREELAADGATREAHRRMVTTAGRTVFFSGITVAAALAALIVFPQRFLYSVGVAGAAVGLLASMIALFGVSAAIALLGERINKWSIRGGGAVSDDSGGWYRLAAGVMRRPARVAIVSSVVMLVLAAPALSTVLTGPSAEAVPPSQPSYEVQNEIDANYTRDASEPITVTVRGELGDRQLRALKRRIAVLDGIETSMRFERADGGADIAFANFGPEGEALGPVPQDAVREIRDLELPDGAELLVSGNTARFIDQKQSLVDHLPLVAGIAITTTLFLLFMLTGSIILPIKTLVMNGLTLAAVLGILTLTFEDGWFDGALGYEGPAAIELITLALVFAITFGLATDYAVLVMARIKEQHDLGLPNREAVAIGISKTGRVITAAAMMLAVVFGAFATSEIFFMKQAAIGQAAGVLIDATIIRALLVPSLMALFGAANWWAPGPLKRFQERYGFKEG